MSEAVSPINQWFDRGSSAVMLALVVVLAASLAKFTWFILAGEPPTITSSGQKLVAAQSQSAQPNVQVNIRQMQSWQLFGKAGAVVKKPAKETAAPLVDTALPLVLEGVFVSKVPEESSAIIAEKGKAGLYYKVADRLPRNAVLDSVHDDHVVINRNGRLEALNFPKASAKGINTSKSRKIAKKKSRTKNARNSRSKRGPKNRVSDLFSGRGGMPTPSAVVSSLSQEISKDSKKFMKEMGVEAVPMSQGGGYRVTGQAPQEILKMIGLKDNDVIKSVNGQPLGVVEEDLSILESFGNGECEAAVEVMRGSSIFSVNFDICSGQLF